MAGSHRRGNSSDGEALTSAFVSYEKQLQAFCLRNGSTAAEDVTQSVFLEAWRRRDEVDFDSRPQTWLYGATKNVLMSQRRREQRKRKAKEELGVTQRHYGDDPSEELTRRCVTRAIVRSLTSLPESQRQVVCLCLLGDHTYEEAAHCLEVPVGTVRSRLSRARRNLALAVRAAGGS